jgi:CheY-like chemotaxis protein/HPt (histidine-containing phosphotransfer) domain-containing protein
MLAPVPPESAQPAVPPDVPGTYAGRRVLLVEDSPINRYIAAEMLRKLGLAVNLAANGAEAVDLVRENAYDLVLMDCHMPQMDGFAAARHIRAWESIAAERPPLPIVALTANAMAGDREACLEAGMSDYLSKPITGAELADMVARHLSAHNTPMPERPGSVAPPTDQGTPPPGATVFDTTRLESLPMVIDGSNPSFATHVLEQFLDIGADTLALFERATLAGDRRTQFRCVHTLKSSGAQIGLDAMAAVAQALEHVLLAGDSPDADAVRRLKDEHQRARRAIAAHLGHEITTQESSG